MREYVSHLHLLEPISQELGLLRRETLHYMARDINEIAKDIERSILSIDALNELYSIDTRLQGIETTLNEAGVLQIRR